MDLFALHLERKSLFETRNEQPAVPDSNPKRQRKRRKKRRLHLLEENDIGKEPTIKTEILRIRRLEKVNVKEKRGTKNDGEMVEPSEPQTEPTHVESIMESEKIVEVKHKIEILSNPSSNCLTLVTSQGSVGNQAPSQNTFRVSTKYQTDLAAEDVP